MGSSVAPTQLFTMSELILLWPCSPSYLLRLWQTPLHPSKPILNILGLTFPKLSCSALD